MRCVHSPSLHCLTVSTAKASEQNQAACWVIGTARSMRASAQRSNGVEPSSMVLATGSGSMEHKGKSRTATAGLSLRAWGMTLRAVHGLKWWPTVLNSREMPITSSFLAIALQVSRPPACAASHGATLPPIPQSSYRLRSWTPNWVEAHSSCRASTAARTMCSAAEFLRHSKILQSIRRGHSSISLPTSRVN